MENAKQKAIRLAWINLIGEKNYETYKDKIQDNGTICFIYQDAGQLGWTKILQDYKYNDKSKVINERWLIPKSLLGIENNKGWTILNKSNDLPSKKIECWFIVDEKIKKGFYNPFKKEFYTKKSIYEPSFITHYQPIVKPLKPIY